MKMINLITLNNKLYRDSFEKAGFQIREFPFSADLNTIKKDFTIHKKNYTVLQLTNESWRSLNRFREITDYLYDKTKLICIADEITPEAGKNLIKCGIADCLPATDVAAVSSYIRILDQRENQKTGKFLILDDNSSHTKILNSIIKRFGYKTEFITDGDTLYSRCGESHIEMILVNLGTRGLDLNSIIRRSYGNSEIKRNPLVCYKCMDEGLFVHELISGLHKITKVILTPQELYSFLTDILFKKEVITASARLNRALKFDQYRDYSASSISAIYYSIQEKLCSQESLFKDETVTDMINLTRTLGRTVAKIEGLRWLNNDADGIKKTTCGAGA